MFKSNLWTHISRMCINKLSFGRFSLTWVVISWFMFRWFQTVSNCSCWQTSIGQPVLFEYGTGCEWHPSNQTLQCPVVTIRCYPWSAGSWQVFHIVGLCVFSHQSADYSIVVAHLTSNSFEGHPCCMHADYLPSLCFWYSPSYHAYWEWIIFWKHRT